MRCLVGFFRLTRLEIVNNEAISRILGAEKREIEKF